MKYKYVLTLTSLVVNYPYQHTARKGGIVGIYSSNVKAETRREEIIIERKEKQNETLTKEDFKIDKIEWV